MRKSFGYLPPNRMISVTRLNGKIFFINADLIQLVESTPDTVITLTNNDKFIVKDSTEEIIQRIIEYKRRVHNSRLVNAEKRNVEGTGA